MCTPRWPGSSGERVAWRWVDKAGFSVKVAFEEKAPIANEPLRTSERVQCPHSLYEETGPEEKGSALCGRLPGSHGGRRARACGCAGLGLNPATETQ